MGKLKVTVDVNVIRIRRDAINGTNIDIIVHDNGDYRVTVNRDLDSRLPTRVLEDMTSTNPVS